MKFVFCSSSILFIFLCCWVLCSFSFRIYIYIVWFWLSVIYCDEYKAKRFSTCTSAFVAYACSFIMVIYHVNAIIFICLEPERRYLTYFSAELMPVWLWTDEFGRILQPVDVIRSEIKGMQMPHACLPSRWERLHHLWATRIIFGQPTSSLGGQHRLWATNIVYGQPTPSMGNQHRLWATNMESLWWLVFHAGDIPINYSRRRAKQSCCGNTFHHVKFLLLFLSDFAVLHSSFILKWFWFWFWFKHVYHIKDAMKNRHVCDWASSVLH